MFILTFIGVLIPIMLFLDYPAHSAMVALGS
jgi:hypothetical protein